MRKLPFTHDATHRPRVFAILRRAEGGVVSPIAIGRELYGRTPSTSQLGSIRRMLQKLREERREIFTLENVPGEGYRLIPAVRS